MKKQRKKNPKIIKIVAREERRKKMRIFKIKGKDKNGNPIDVPKPNWETIDLSYDKWRSSHPLYGPPYRRDKEMEDLIMHPDKYRK